MLLSAQLEVINSVNCRVTNTNFCLELSLPLGMLNNHFGPFLLAN